MYRYHNYFAGSSLNTGSNPHDKKPETLHIWSHQQNTDRRNSTKGTELEICGITVVEVFISYTKHRPSHFRRAIFDPPGSGLSRSLIY